MTTALQALFESFDALSEDERHVAAVELLRGVASTDELPDEALVEAADEVFRELDTREAADADLGGSGSGAERPESIVA